MNETWVRVSWILTSDEDHHLLPGRSSNVLTPRQSNSHNKHENGTLRFCHNQVFSYCNRIN